MGIVKAFEELRKRSNEMKETEHKERLIARRNNKNPKVSLLNYGVKKNG